jgi:hypothetical protein
LKLQSCSPSDPTVWKPWKMALINNRSCSKSPSVI